MLQAKWSKKLGPTRNTSPVRCLGMKQSRSDFNENQPRFNDILRLISRDFASMLGLGTPCEPTLSLGLQRKLNLGFTQVTRASPIMYNYSSVWNMNYYDLEIHIHMLRKLEPASQKLV